tara:strand:- start:2178 stop:2528 length:351 start_codon:yes stop_codon:yes gene_type:complete
MEAWTIDELISLTETVQSKEVEYNGKSLIVQWCELTEAEEPKLSLPSEDATEEEKNQHFSNLAGIRVLHMIEKANSKDSDNAILNEENWSKLPTTLRWRVQNTILGTAEVSDKENF